MTPEEFRTYRLALGLTQKQLAPLLGYKHTPRIAELESGVREPTACAVLLLRAYMSGYRPPDWPV
jgi:predicted transcriptional regulator